MLRWLVFPFQKLWSAFFQDANRQLTRDLYETKDDKIIGEVYYLTLRSQKCATWNHSMRKTWRMRHRLTTLPHSSHQRWLW